MPFATTLPGGPFDLCIETTTEGLTKLMMSVTLRIPFEQLKEIVKQLSPAEAEELRAQLASFVERKEEPKSNPLQELLLKGPTMDEAQLKEMEKNRERINRWRD